MPTRSVFTRWPVFGAAGAAVRPRDIEIAAEGIIVAAIILVVAGCATFGRRGRSDAATARDLSRQAQTAIHAGQQQHAEALLRDAMESSPENGEIRRQLADVLWHRGAANEAMSHMAAAMRFEPDDATLAVGAGEMALAASSPDVALSHAEQAIRLDPQLASAWALRGRVFRQLNQPDRALADLQRALVFEPGDADVLFELAVIYRERGQSARCLTTLHHLHDTYPPGAEPQAALMLEGLTLIELNRPHQAAEVLLAATHRGPPSAELLFNLARAQSAAGRPSEATSAVEQALAVDSSHQQSRQLLVQLAAQSAEAARRR